MATKNSKQQKIEASQLVVLVILSILLSLGVIRTTKSTSTSGDRIGGNLSIDSFEITSDGTITTKQYGYPLVYKDKTLFEAKDPVESTVATASFEEQGLSVPRILINVAFWFGLLFTIWTFIKSYRRK